MVIAGGLAPNHRLSVPDALRGVAALGVVFHHLLHNTVMEVPLRTVLPSVVETAMTYGARGVQMFFVLSGFVITWSLRRTVMTAGAAGQFALRRQVRLDPTYWVVIAATLLLGAVEAGFGFQNVGSGFGVVDVLTNVFYLQNITGSPEIVGVAWTLCLEVQFYALLLAILLLGRRLAKPSGPDVVRASLVPVLWVTGVASVLFASGTDADQWASEYWFYFVMGALTALTARAGWQVLWPASLAVVMLVAAVLTLPEDSPVDIELSAPVAGAVAMVLLAWGHRGSPGLERLAGDRVLQYLGSRSYSLYLVHLLVLSAVLRAAYKVTGENGVAALGWLVVAAAAVFVVAEVLYRSVELPSLRLGQRIRTEGASAVLGRRGRSRTPAP